MKKAVLALATGYFYKRPTAHSLRDSFACTWVHQMPASGSPPVIVTPDGTIDLQWFDGRFRVAGPDKDPQVEFVPAGAAVIGFRFRPAAAAAWLRLPAIEIVSRRVWLDELWGSKAHSMAGSVGARQNVEGLIDSLEAVVARWAPAHTPIDVPMRAAYDLIDSGPPPEVPLLSWLGRALAMNERTLRRRFYENFGYGPKTLDRILRYQRFLRLRRTSKEPTAVLAAEAGYSDQAHLVRESRRLTGSTPGELGRIMGTGSGSHERWSGETSPP